MRAGAPLLRDGAPAIGLSRAITTIPKEILTRRIAALEPGKVVAVDRAVRFALGLV